MDSSREPRRSIVDKPKELDPPLPEVSIDIELKKGLLNIQTIMSRISSSITKSGIPDRSVVQSLKDCIQMLSDLKKAEQDLMQDMTEEQLKEVLKK